MKKDKNLLKKQSRKYFLGIDDFGYLMPNFDILLRLKKTYPDFKITLFTVALPHQILIKENLKYFSEEKYKKWAEMINSYDWIQIAVHGLYHTHGEMLLGYEKTKMLIQAIENVFKRIGLKYVKLVKAPYWQYSWFALKALRDKGYAVALDRNHPMEVPKNIKHFYYNWSYNEPLPDKDIIIGHGHLFKGGHKNDIETCFENILNNIPLDAKFGFLDEVISNNSKNGK